MEPTKLTPIYELNTNAMKRIFLLLITVVAISYSCDKLEEFLIDHTFEESYPVNLTANDPTTFGQEFHYDATDNQEVADNINDLSGYKVNSLKFSVSEFLPDTGIVSGVFSFYFKNSAGNQIGDMTSLSIDNLFALSASGDKVDVPLSPETVTAVQNEFGATNKVTAVFSGSVSDVPVSFIATLFLTIGINVDPT